MQFRILGPFEVAGADGAIPLPRAKPRTLLALLLLRATQVVSADALIEELWRGHPPASAAKLLQVYVSQLRRALADGGRIETRAPGYVLAVALPASGFLVRTFISTDRREQPFFQSQHEDDGELETFAAVERHQLHTGRRTISGIR